MRGFGGLVESTGILRASSLSNDLLFDSTLITAEGLDFVIRWDLQKKVKILPNFLTLYRISDNQLHNDVELITRNASTLASKYSQSLNVGKKTFLRQNAYFALANMRDWRKSEIIFQMSRYVFTLNFEVLFMAFWIVGRNLHAKLLSQNTKKIAKAHLFRLNA
jgi:hypothetical protein